MKNRALRRARRASVSLRPTALEPLETRQLLSAALATTDPLTAPTAAIIASAVAGGDAYEANNSRETAFELTTPGGALSDVNGLATFTDNDWYRVRVGVGEFTAQLRSTLSADDLNIELYDANGNKLDGNYTREDNSTVSATLTTEQDLFVFIYGNTTNGSPYQLLWNGTETTPTVPTTPTTPPTPTPEPPTPTPEPPTTPTPPTVPTGEDAYEQNDIPSQADLITKSSGALSTTDGFATATDTDWYRFTAAAGTFTATLDHVAADGELNIELYDANGNKLDGAYRSENTSTVTADLAVAQEVRVFIYGSGGFQGNAYDISWAGQGVTPPTTPPPTPEPPTTDPTPEPPTTPTPPTVPTGEDAYEQNDIPSQADLITAASGALSTTDGFATATDTDWYRFNAAAGTFTATLDSVASEGELNIELYDVNGNKLDGNYNRENRSTVSAELATAQEVRVFIYGSGGFQGNAYDISWAGQGVTPPTTPTPPDADADA